MVDAFMNLSFSFIMDLYRTKSSAESRGDISAIDSLKRHYPELFTDEFEEFIEGLKATVAYLDRKYDEDFSSIFVSKVSDTGRIIN